MTETQQTINNVIAKMIAYSDGNKHDIAHFLKVYTYARMIGEMENLTERKQETLEIAAVIHDIACPVCRVKYGNTNGSNQEKESPELVEKFLKDVEIDDEMKERVKKHKESRPQNWKTYEIYKDIYTIINDISKEHKTVILDCVTLLVNNLMFTYEIDIDNSTQDEINGLEKYIKEQVEKLLIEIKKTNLYFVIVTNELGLGGVSINKLTRIYTDIIGRINQQIATHSDEVYFVVSGIPMKIKG